MAKNRFFSGKYLYLEHEERKYFLQFKFFSVIGNIFLSERQRVVLVENIIFYSVKYFSCKS